MPHGLRRVDVTAALIVDLDGQLWVLREVSQGWPLLRLIVPGCIGSLLVLHALLLIARFTSCMLLVIDIALRFLREQLVLDILDAAVLGIGSISRRLLSVKICHFFKIN